MRDEDASRRAERARPTPAALRGNHDPSRRVRPVDWTADGRATPPRDAADPPENGAGAVPGAAPGAKLPARRAPKPAPRRVRTIPVPRPAPAPPVGAVHSVSPEDPHPVPRPLQIHEHLIRVVGASDVTAEQIVLAVADPEEAWTADVGVSDHFLRGGLVVQVRRTDNAVIGAFSRRYALAVRPEEYQADVDIAIQAAGKSARRGLGTRHPTTRRELLERMASAGFEVTDGSTHGRVTHPEHPGLFVPLASTPSDVRFTRRAVTQLRRVFGIDLRR